MSKQNTFIFLSVWIVLTQTFPPSKLLFSFSNSLMFGIYILATLVLFPSLFTKRSIIALIVYTAISFFYYLSGNAFFDSINAVITIPLVMISGLLMAEYAFNYDFSYHFSIAIIYTVLLSNIIMAILSIPQIVVSPDIIRYTSVGNNYEGEEVNRFVWVMQYQTVHGLPLLFAPMVFLCRKMYATNKIRVVLLALVILLLFYVLFRSNAATAFLMSVLMIAIGLMFKMEKFDKKSFSKIALVGIVGVLLMQPAILSPIVDSIQGVMDPSGASYKRIGQLRDNLLYGDSEGDLELRQDLYATSSQLFLESPILGTSTPERISRHTWIVDRFALFGILFIIPLILVFVYHIKSVYPKLIHTKVIYSTSVACLLTMLFLKNDFAQGTWFYGFAYLPLLCRYIDYSIDLNKNKKTKIK